MATHLEIPEAKLGQIKAALGKSGRDLIIPNSLVQTPLKIGAPVPLGIQVAGTPARSTRIVLHNWQSPGDMLMLTATVRDLHKAYPGRFDVGVNTSCGELWDNNPLVTKVSAKDTPEDWLPTTYGGKVRFIPMHYPLINKSNESPYHFLHGFTQWLESQIGLRIPVTDYKGDIYLTQLEKDRNIVQEKSGYGGKYWVMMAGGKWDYTTKWWNPSYYQDVINHFQGKIKFVQCGNKNHFHRPLDNSINMVGQTTLREFISLMYRAEGVICPVTFAMHLAAALPPKDKKITHKPCVVIAGGREPPSFTLYNNHQYLHNIGCLPCSQWNGCWRSRAQKVGDGDLKDTERLCENPVQVEPNLAIAKCMMLIKPADVCRAIEKYYEGGTLEYGE
jgi:ADP-heptose:LPS heptosyltransferase